MEKDRLILPVYLNDNIIMDMLAIIEDGFSMVSEINSSAITNESSGEKINTSLSTANILSKLLKIELGAERSNDSADQNSVSSKTEKVHTSASLFSKFRSKLLDMNLLTTANYDINEIEPGDFIEVSGELLKNPMVNIMEKIIDVFRMVDIFADKPELGSKKQFREKNSQDTKLVNQMKKFLEELKVTGTIDFIMKNKESTIVLSAQERYLQNDNISEILGGNFKVLGKVIKVCKYENDSINLLRKTTLDVLDEESLNAFMAEFKDEELASYNLPEVEFKINSPAIIVIPIAIYV